jgi:alpha-mannosidase
VSERAGGEGCFPLFLYQPIFNSAAHRSPLTAHPLTALALDIHVVTHTHWDREWYHPVERFRQRLVALVDELIDDPPSARESFLLDGQAIIIDDYLAVRPERTGELSALVRDGRLEAGPWYVLADELIPSGEALVRNLFAGRRVLRRFGAEAPPVLYCPDSFGHPAALPAIAAGFGLPMIVLWRGYGGPRWPAGDTARWTAPSGDSAVLFHLPRDGYEFGSHLPADSAGARERWQRMRAELVPRSTTGVMLVPNGADHHARQLHLQDGLAAIEDAGSGDGVHRSSLRAFSERLLERALVQRLPAVRGELRDSYGYTWTLQGTFATRAHEKRMNAAAERALLREAEPWSALAAFKGSSRRPLVEAAWRTLLEAHPHDTICGCSIDEVAQAMELRVRSAVNQAVGIRDDSIAALLGHDAVAAHKARERWQSVVVIRNAAPRRRSGVAIVEIEEFVADVPVGPGSAREDEPVSVSPLRKPVIPALGSVQVLSRGLRNSRTESPRDYPDNDLVAETTAAVWIDDLPEYGCASFLIGSGDARRRRTVQPVTVGERTVSNSVLSLEVSDDGRVSLVENASRRRIESLIEIVDEADVGDSYTPAPRAREHIVEHRGTRRVHRGPLRGELSLRYRVRSGGATDVDLDIRLTLDAESPFVRVRVIGDNRRENHRVRLVLNSDVHGGDVWADAAFGPVKRERLVLGEEESRVEHALASAPLHRYVSRFTESAGVTVFSDGLAEYEARDDGSVAVTLVRSIGELSRNDLPERPGHAGWPAPIPLAQCLGPFQAELAVMLHGPRLVQTIDLIERTANDVLLPMRGFTLRSALSVPAPVQGIGLSGAGLACSAIKESEDSEWIVLRCVNLCDVEVTGSWSLPFAPRHAAIARIDETIIQELELSGANLPVRAAPRQIVTMLVR